MWTKKGHLTGQKKPFKLEDIWRIRTRLEIEGNIMELALLNLAIDCKLRSCDLLRKVRISPMCALRRLTSLDARRGSQQMALVLCKKHNTAGRLVSHALRGLHSNRLSALSAFGRPRHAFSQMP